MRRKANSRKIKEKDKFGETVVLRTLRLEGSQFKVELNISELKIIFLDYWFTVNTFFAVGKAKIESSIE